MSRREQSLVIVAGTAIAYAGIAYSGPSLAQEHIGAATDLTAVIALQAKSCGKVVNATKQGEDDYVAVCENGNRYRVSVKDGRVVVEKIG